MQTDTETLRPARQATLAGAFARKGRGLHTGRRASVTVRPAPAGHGHVFRRTGPRGSSEILAHWSAVTPAILCTALLYPDGRILRTVEHLLAALSAYAIDNALIEIEGEELPIFDGSALPWCEAIAAVGRAELEVPRHYLRVTDPVEVGDEDNNLRITPSDGFSIEIEVPLAHFGNLTWAGEVTTESFHRELAPARSFGRLKWALPMKLYNLVSLQPVLRGANLSSTAVGARPPPRARHRRRPRPDRPPRPWSHQGLPDRPRAQSPPDERPHGSPRRLGDRRFGGPEGRGLKAA